MPVSDLDMHVCSFNFFVTQISIEHFTKVCLTSKVDNKFISKST